MITTEVRNAPFNELLGLTTRLLTQAESLAALVARLKLDAAGEGGDPEVTAQLNRVMDALGANGLCANLDERERTTVIGHATTMLRQATELIDDPLRPGGWFYTDPQIIQGQGASSVIVAQLLVGAGIGTPDARILDIGIELARQNAAASGLGSRITLRQTRIEAFEDADGFDLVWMPVIFLPRATLEAAVRRAVATMRPGAKIVLGRYTGSDDPLVGALGDLRTTRSGGTLLGPADTRALLEDAGLVDVREIERTWPAPLGPTVGRRRPLGSH